MWRRVRRGSACQSRASIAVPRLLRTQATIRRLAGRATPVTSCDQQTSTFHRVPTLPSVCVALFSAAVGATPGLTATLFFPALQSCCASCRWPGRCCATSCVLAAAGLLVHTARLFPSPPAGYRLGGRRLCIDIWPARRCGRCDDILVHVQKNI